MRGWMNEMIFILSNFLSLQLTVLPVDRRWSSRSDEMILVVNSVSAAVPAPQQLRHKNDKNHFAVLITYTVFDEVLLDIFGNIVYFSTILISNYSSLRWRNKYNLTLEVDCRITHFCSPCVCSKNNTILENNASNGGTCLDWFGWLHSLTM